MLSSLVFTMLMLSSLVFAMIDALYCSLHDAMCSLVKYSQCLALSNLVFTILMLSSLVFEMIDAL